MANGPLATWRFGYVCSVTSRTPILPLFLVGVGTLAAVGTVAAVFTRNPAVLFGTCASLALLVLGWFVLRANTGLKVRREFQAGAVDPRLGGIGTKHYSAILAVAVVVAVLAWLAVNSNTAVAAICVLGILVCALTIGRIRSKGYRQRQAQILQETR